ncbi:MAG TPA: MASE1 domain-containing protein [Candidatus Acidoferrum sp.]|nr:MASE1 domain-containing protein [Candidatus Acidoferrum sp.]
MFRSRVFRDAALLAALTAAYFVAGKLGLKLASVNASASAVWPCTGIALAALLIFGYRVWPAILAGAFLVNLTTAGSFATSIGIATGNTLEGVAGCYLVSRFADGQRAFEKAQNVFKFALLGGMFSTALSATLGVTTLALSGFADWSKYAAIWRTWWLGDAVGAVVVTPLLVLWWQNPRLDWNRRQIIELGILFLGLFSTGWIVFGGFFQPALKNYPFEYLCIPFLGWAAFRFGRRKAATATFLLAAIATLGTLHGFGPFARESQNTSLLLVQTFMGIMAVTSLVLAAEVTEHRRAEEHVRELVVTDPLTGLANYRRLLEALEAEIKRYGRTRRPFAIILLDLDGLKKINDAYGHLVGSRALCRVADVLRLHSRAIDTAARYGGDEFVLVLAETELKEAQQVAQRISDRLREDGETPALSVSSGTAIYPQNGSTVEELLGAADRALYKQKGSQKKKLQSQS